MAAQPGHAEVVRALITKRAKVDCKDRLGDTVLCLAAREGHEAVVCLLIDAGADVNGLGVIQTPLTTAAIWGHGNVARILLQHGAIFDVVNPGIGLV